jgi:hypothetical protein
MSMATRVAFGGSSVAPVDSSIRSADVPFNFAVALTRLTTMRRLWSNLLSLAGRRSVADEPESIYDVLKQNLSVQLNISRDVIQTARELQALIDKETDSDKKEKLTHLRDQLLASAKQLATNVTASSTTSVSTIFGATFGDKR